MHRERSSILTTRPKYPWAANLTKLLTFHSSMLFRYQRLLLPAWKLQARQGQQANQGDSYALFNSQAQDLITRYNAARRKATFAPLFRDKEAGRSELNEIQSEKLNLMNDIEKSPMEQTRKNEILKKLSQVPD